MPKGDMLCSWEICMIPRGWGYIKNIMGYAWLLTEPCDGVRMMFRTHPCRLFKAPSCSLQQRDGGMAEGLVITYSLLLSGDRSSLCSAAHLQCELKPIECRNISKVSAGPHPCRQHPKYHHILWHPIKSCQRLANLRNFPLLGTQTFSIIVITIFRPFMEPRRLQPRLNFANLDFWRTPHAKTLLLHPNGSKNKLRPMAIKV